MKTLFDLCKPRESVFDETLRDDVLDLTDLAESRIAPSEFFEENFITDGMRVLFESAFKRFKKQGSTSVIKLTQAMGGGKTHNMIALGLLAKHPQYREKVMGAEYKNDTLGKVNVIAFTGRESDIPFGIWGAVAHQLGKKEMFKDYYSPLSAPGQKAWINLLKGDPLLILMDELPPYLENAKSKTIGNSDLSVVTTNALANLFAALGKKDLSNVCLVISDLKATYESGSDLLQSSFKELENEVNRSALNIEPVSSASDEVYYILRKRLFQEMPTDEDITEIANAYKDSVNEARQMGYTNTSPSQTFVGIKDSYPFHLSIKDLYARFKENAGFQQTRGLIRYMRAVISQIYTGNEPLAKIKYLVNVFDFDLNDRNMHTIITQIKPSLTNAISHDIAAKGKAIAEIVDKEMNQSVMQELSKLLLVSSLADVPNALLGLNLQETIGYLCEPGKDITQVKKALDEFIMKSWYLYSDRDGRLFFKNTKNMIAEINSLVNSYDNESAKKELREFLANSFTPKMNDCYQNVHIFPAIDEINVSEDKLTIILFEPYTQGGLNPELQSFYDDTLRKNRIMFLSGQRNTMDKLLQAAKEYKAIQVIIGRMDEEKVSKKEPQYLKANEKIDKIRLSLLQTARETFVTLYYPSKTGLMKADFLMQFTNNEFNGEQQVKDVLLHRHKFTEDISGDIFRKKCEDRLFTQKEMRWVDIKSRASTNPSWQWHLPRALDDLKDDMLKKGKWKEHGGYLEKPPFPLEKTDVIIQELHRNENTGESTLRLSPKYGDKLFYEIGASATSASKKIKIPKEFKTKEMKLSFLCVDSSGDHETGDPRNWANKITLKYRVYDKEDDKILEIQSAPISPVKYTTDGSNPKEHGGLYDGEFIIPQKSTHVLAIAENQGIYSDLLTIQINRMTEETIEIDKTKPLTLNRKVKTNDTSETYSETGQLKKHKCRLSEVVVTFFKTNEKTNQKGWVELSIDQSTEIDPEVLETEMDNIRINFMSEGKVNISLGYSAIIFSTGQQFLDWVAEKKLLLKEFKPEDIIQ